MSGKLKIGYALGGGSARGLAHIGVLKVLETNGIRPDVIVGTSIGAIIGALYAGGHVAGEIEQIVLALDWKKMVALADISIPAGGFVQGKKVVALLESIIGHLSFFQLKIPFACASTDVLTGEEIILHDGSLVDAVRASISLPGVFRPVKSQGRYLVDGGLLNEVPVSVCRRLGADYVIGVNVIPAPDKVMQNQRAESGEATDANCETPAETPVYKLTSKPYLAGIEKAVKDFITQHNKKKKTCTDETGKTTNTVVKPPTLWEVVSQSLAIMQYHVAMENIKTADMVISPDIANIGFWQFTRAAEAIKAGGTAAREALAQGSLLKDINV
jgi:predicted acylesterase/phospholipase RssA